MTRSPTTAAGANILISSRYDFLISFHLGTSGFIKEMYEITARRTFLGWRQCAIERKRLRMEGEVSVVSKGFHYFFQKNIENSFDFLTFLMTSLSFQHQQSEQKRQRMQKIAFIIFLSSFSPPFDSRSLVDTMPISFVLYYTCSATGDVREERRSEMWEKRHRRNRLGINNGKRGECRKISFSLLLIVQRERSRSC